MDNPNDPDNAQYCSIISRTATEPLYGTAPMTDVWLLLEYPYPVGRKALPESNLSPEVMDHLTALQKHIPHSRLVLMRNEQSQMDGSLRLFIADAREDNQRLYEIQLLKYGDLLSVDVSAVLAGNPASNVTQVEKPMYIVCTNGKRDACCARWGLPAYQALTKNSDHRVWQSSHVGGHRFAANMICLPHGIYFGRLSPETVDSVADAYARGNLALDNYRGRGSYPPPAQAAEYYLRSKTRDFSLNSYTLLSTQEIQPDRWQVTFTSTIDSSTHELLVVEKRSGEMIFESCSAPEERKPVSFFEMAGYVSGN